MSEELDVQNKSTDEGVVTSKVHWKEYLNRMNFPDGIDEMCKFCIKKQEREFGAQNIKCGGLASVDNIVSPELKQHFSNEELLRIQEIADPYTWARRHIDGIEMRWYQEMMVRCTAKRRVYRCGRRSGKTFSFGLNILHRVLTNDYYKVLIATPYEIQAEELINTIRDLIYKLNPDYGTYKELVVKDVKSPSYFVKFSNGSRIRALTTGSSGAGSSRGQAADLIVLDEVDYMSDADIDSISAILADNPETELWMASTPTGKKGRFYDRCHDKKYKEFHFPSSVLPHYDDELDEDFRTGLTDIGYVHEILAEFGESEHGVFQKVFIEEATKEDVDRKHALQFRNQYSIALGCDWNDDKVGTRLQAVAFNKHTSRFMIVDRKTIAREGWTQVDAVQAIVDMNRKWNFDYIYVDEGFGVSSTQFIKKYALDLFGKLPEDHPDLKLADVEGINASSKITVRDIVTSEEIKKDMKSYMVENTVRMLERGAIVLDEEYDAELIKQMHNYIIERRTPVGKPVYAAEEDKIGDHDLDAFMLALLSFAMEMSSFIGDIDVAPVFAPVQAGAKIEFDEDGNMISKDDTLAPAFATGVKEKGSSFYRKRISNTNRTDFNSSSGKNMLSSSPRVMLAINGETKTSRAQLMKGKGTRRSSF